MFLLRNIVQLHMRLTRTQVLRLDVVVKHLFLLTRLVSCFLVFFFGYAFCMLSVFYPFEIVFFILVYMTPEGTLLVKVL